MTPRTKISILVDSPVLVASEAGFVAVPVLTATATAEALEILVAAGVPFGVEIQDVAGKIENKNGIEKEGFRIEKKWQDCIPSCSK